LEESGKGYWFIDREDFEEEVHLNNFLECGEHNGNLYGTHLESIRAVIKEGLCLMSK
jgi:guanylate kinase